MRIGITCYPTYGGSGAVATELGLELARRGHEVHFISYASPFRLRGYAERVTRSEEHTSELQSQSNLVCRLLLEKKKSLNVRQKRLFFQRLQQGPCAPKLSAMSVIPRLSHSGPRDLGQSSAAPDRCHSQWRRIR